MKGISLLAVAVSILTVLLVASARARADNPNVTIIKQPVRLAYRIFDPRRPPRDMPELTPPEQAAAPAIFSPMPTAARVVPFSKASRGPDAASDTASQR